MSDDGSGARLLEELRRFQGLVKAHVESAGHLAEENARLKEQLADLAAIPPSALEPNQPPLPQALNDSIIPAPPPDDRDEKSKDSNLLKPVLGKSNDQFRHRASRKMTDVATKFEKQRSQTRAILKDFINQIETGFKVVRGKGKGEGKGEMKLSRVLTQGTSSMERTLTYGSADTMPSGRVFADADMLKQHLQDNLLCKKAEIEYSCYSESSFCGRLVQTKQFEIMSMCFVVANSLWISIDMDVNKEPLLHKSHWVFQVIAHTFCAWFVSELSIRLLAFEKKAWAATDAPFLFDAVLVALIVSETWVIPLFMVASGSEINTGMRAFVVLRMLRLFRALRLVRVLRQLPELLVIVRGIGIAFKAISLVITLIFFIIYVTAIVLCVMTEGLQIREQQFETVLESAQTLLLECTLSGSKGVRIMADSIDESFVVFLLLFAYVLIANITMMGVMTGLLVRTVQTTAEVEKEEAQLRFISDTVDEMWEQLHDLDGDGLMSELELLDTLGGDKEFSACLHSMGVDVLAFVDVSSYVFKQHGADGKLSKPAFKKVILNMRGKNAAKVKDHVETRFYIHEWLSKMEDNITHATSRVSLT